jgi:phosphoglycerol transferase MdoB-like AlkP superfamily enzyme
MMGQVDVYPTILDLMGANDYEWKGLGHSVLRNPVGAVAIEPDVVKGKAVPDLVKRLKQAWQISNLMITRNYFQKVK